MAGGDAYANVELRQTALEAGEVGQLATKRGKPGNLIERREAGEAGLLLPNSTACPWPLRSH
jgi:hypothetical protein